MRDTFHDDLDALNGQLVTMAESVAEAIRDASASLLDQDRKLGKQVIAADQEINAIQYSVDDRVAQLMTQHQPIASDLRFILSSIRITTDLERMGDMAKHVAKIARRNPQVTQIAEVQPVWEAMAKAGSRIAEKTARILATRNQVDAAQLDLDDDEMDAQYAALLRILAGEWPHGAESAVDVAMLGRSFERFADHAVRVAHQVVYLVTGEVHLDRPV